MIDKSQEIGNYDPNEITHTIFEKVPPDRTAVDNILRLNYSNQLRLTLMADTKANIMITVSSIVFSITLANINKDILFYPLRLKRPQDHCLHFPVGQDLLRVF